MFQTPDAARVLAVLGLIPRSGRPFWAMLEKRRHKSPPALRLRPVAILSMRRGQNVVQRPAERVSGDFAIFLSLYNLPIGCPDR